MFEKRVFAAVLGAVGLVAAGFGAVGCGPKQGDSNANDTLRGPEVASTYSLAFRVYENGEPKDEIITLKRNETTRNTSEDINRAHDYSLRAYEGSQDPREFLPFQTSLVKWGSKGLSGSAPLSPDEYFEMTFFTREVMQPGKTYHCTDNRMDPVCNFSLNLPVSTVVSTNELGENQVKKLFEVAPSRLRCDVQVGRGSLELKMHEEVGSVRNYRTAPGIPVGPNSEEGGKKFAFVFKCEDIRSGKSAVYGYLLQNTNDVPSLQD